jgi:MEDS: MEthanogen/methylotroph, DcmR Sensory domain
MRDFSGNPTNQVGRADQSAVSGVTAMGDTCRLLFEPAITRAGLMPQPVKGFYRSMPYPCHQVHFYSADTALIESSARFIATGLKANNVAVVILTKSHREGLAQNLKAQGFDVDGAIQQGSYVPMDATDILSTIMTDGVPDRVRFFEGLCDLIESAAKAAKKEHPRIALCAECVGLLCAEGNTRAALQLEETGNDLIELYDVDIFCAYPLNSFQTGEDDDAFESICALHTAIYTQ